MPSEPNSFLPPPPSPSPREPTAPGSISLEHIYNEVHALRAELDEMARWLEVFVRFVEHMPGVPPLAHSDGR